MKRSGEPAAYSPSNGSAGMDPKPDRGGYTAKPSRYLVARGLSRLGQGKKMEAF
jgi:hypothetical protein